MADILAEDCRLDGFNSLVPSQPALWYRATHLPTGVVVEVMGTTKRRLMEALQRKVNEEEHAHD